MRDEIDHASRQKGTHPATEGVRKREGPLLLFGWLDKMLVVLLLLFFFLLHEGCPPFRACLAFSRTATLPVALFRQLTLPFRRDLLWSRPDVIEVAHQGGHL